MTRYKFLFAAVLLAGCRSYEMKAPENFDAEAVTVAGKLGSLKLGEFQISRVERSWTKGSGLQIMSVKSEKRRQEYRFRLASTDSHAVDARCEFATRERSVGLKGGWEIMAGEGAALTCQAMAASPGAGQGQAQGAGAEPSNEFGLKLSTESDAVLSGEYQAGRSYRVQGVGMAAFTGGRKGPAAGFHIFDNDRAVASVQIVGPRRVLFARGLGAAQRAELAPAIAALLLLDESLREF